MIAAKGKIGCGGEYDGEIGNGVCGDSMKIGLKEV